ncbi:MAG: flippase-like domain-containing protein [Ignavibacteriales bacterium]|nr:flippase-like domain-containing protein [Ignavibacteriales bacterium]MCF8435982.1 flippase-like domain-containing protein [Ignavibacteriales bacterium]
MTSAKKRILNIFLGYIFPGLLAIVLLYFVFRDMDFSIVFGYISAISFSWLIIFLAIFMFSHYLRALRWKVMLRSIKPETSVSNLFGAVMIGYGVNCIIPRLGELYRGLFLGRWEKISRTSILATVILERIIDIIALGVAVGIAVAIYPGELYSKVQWLKTVFILVFGFVLFIAVLMVLLVRFRESIILYIHSKTEKRFPVFSSFVIKSIEQLSFGFSCIRGVKDSSIVAIYSALIMIAYAYTSLAGFYLLRMDSIMDVNFTMAWILLSVSAFGVVMPTPGGTGSYHAIVIFVLVSLLGFSYEISAAYAILTHIISYIVFIFLALVSYYFVNSKMFKAGIPKENFISVFRKSKNED